MNGVVVSIETFRKELEKRGHEFFIFCPHFDGYKDSDPDHVFRFPSVTLFGQSYYPIGIPLLGLDIIKNIKNLNLDIIHTQQLFDIGKLGLDVGRHLKIPVVHTYHTLITEYVHYVPILPKKLKQDTLIAMSKRYCNKCDKIVTPSPSMERALLKYGVTTSIESIPTGIEMKNFQDPYHKDVLRTKWHIPEHARILLYLSRIGKEKNIEFLLKAMKDLVELRTKKFGKPDVHLLMVGGGPELKNYKQMAIDMGLNAHVTFTDMMPKEKANRYFGAADIFVFPSITETQGIVVTEAMASGTPVVAINKMGPSDLVKDGVDGYLTGLKVSEFTDKIIKLLDNDKLRREFAKNAKKNALEYTTQISAIKMEKLYNDTINNYISKRKIKKQR